MTMRLKGIVESDWLIWVGLAIGVGGFARGAATVPAALVPVWAGEQWGWIAWLAAIAVLAAAVSRWSKRPIRFAVFLGGAVTMAAFDIGAVATVALIVLTAFALGARIIDLAAPEAPSPIDFFRTTVVGLSACSLWLGVTAHWRINFVPAYLLLSAVVLGFNWRYLRSPWREIADESPPADRGVMTFLLHALLWFAFAFHIVYAAQLERYPDALAMHLAIAHALSMFGYWNFDPHEYVWAVQPLGADWLFGWAYVLAGESAAKLLNGVFLILICGLIVRSELVSRRWALLATAILTLMPLTFIETASLFVENTLTMFVVAAILCAARIGESPSRAFIVGFAVAAAGAIAVKLHGVIALGVIGLALLVSGNWRDALRLNRSTLGIGVLAFAAGLWPYIYAWWATGNPVFPYFNAIFKSPFYPLENFDTGVYPRGISLTDFYDLTFRSNKYVEGWEGVAGFAGPLLLPAGVIMAAAGSRLWRFVGFTAIGYVLLILLNVRYLRYIFPAFPLIALLLVYPGTVAKGAITRAVIVTFAVVGLGWGVMRIPAAGWLLERFNPPSAFSPRMKELAAVADVPPRPFLKLQSEIGDLESRVVMFGQPIGTYLKGRPVYTNWYFPAMQWKVITPTDVESAAAALTEVRATHVVFDNRQSVPLWQPWRQAAEKYGRLVARTNDVELYEFRGREEPGTSLFTDTTPWKDWELTPPQQSAMAGNDLVLPPTVAASKPANVAALEEGAVVTLAAEHQCAGRSFIRAQINWLHQNGSILHVEAGRSNCRETPGTASVSSAKPKGAELAYLFFINDGQVNARLYGERASFRPKPDNSARSRTTR